ncbi:MAG: hypothetical protein IGR76_15390 [Synechococcales cyanobacterium T60_A2020_003]|nr:hypothetical protein [Synechococcales cyanobacterium T60_A2020_003]
MTNTEQSSSRFRSATEFPKSIDHLPTQEANQLYQEMRDCLVFTNRSRAQLIRRNGEYKQSTLQLKQDVERLNGYIQRLRVEKEQLTTSNQQVITELEREIITLSQHLDHLSDVFDQVADVDSLEKTKWSYLSFPSRFFNFIRAVRAIVTAWRTDEDGTQPVLSQPSLESLPAANEDEVVDKVADAREHPWMYDDPASTGRSLLDR